MMPICVCHRLLATQKGTSVTMWMNRGVSIRKFQPEHNRQMNWPTPLNGQLQPILVFSQLGKHWTFQTNLFRQHPVWTWWMTGFRQPLNLSTWYMQQHRMQGVHSVRWLMLLPVSVTTQRMRSAVQKKLLLLLIWFKNRWRLPGQAPKKQQMQNCSYHRHLVQVSFVVMNWTVSLNKHLTWFRTLQTILMFLLEKSGKWQRMGNFPLM